MGLGFVVAQVVPAVLVQGGAVDQHRLRVLRIGHGVYGGRHGFHSGLRGRFGGCFRRSLGFGGGLFRGLAALLGFLGGNRVHGFCALLGFLGGRFFGRGFLSGFPTLLGLFNRRLFGEFSVLLGLLRGFPTLRDGLLRGRLVFRLGRFPIFRAALLGRGGPLRNLRRGLLDSCLGGGGRLRSHALGGGERFQLQDLVLKMHGHSAVSRGPGVDDPAAFVGENQPGYRRPGLQEVRGDIKEDGLPRLVVEDGPQGALTVQPAQGVSVGAEEFGAVEGSGVVLPEALEGDASAFVDVEPAHGGIGGGGIENLTVLVVESNLGDLGGVRHIREAKVLGGPEGGGAVVPKVEITDGIGRG